MEHLEEKDLLNHYACTLFPQELWRWYAPTFTLVLGEPALVVHKHGVTCLWARGTGFQGQKHECSVWQLTRWVPSNYKYAMKTTPGCLGDLLGMKSYPVILGLFHKPWNKDPYQTTNISLLKRDPYQKTSFWNIWIPVSHFFFDKDPVPKESMYPFFFRCSNGVLTWGPLLKVAVGIGGRLPSDIKIPPKIATSPKKWWIR